MSELSEPGGMHGQEQTVDLQRIQKQWLDKLRNQPQVCLEQLLDANDYQQKVIRELAGEVVELVNRLDIIDNGIAVIRQAGGKAEDISAQVTAWDADREQYGYPPFKPGNAFSEKAQAAFEKEFDAVPDDVDRVTAAKALRQLKQYMEEGGEVPEALQQAGRIIADHQTVTNVIAGSIRETLAPVYADLDRRVAGRLEQLDRRYNFTERVKTAAASLIESEQAAPNQTAQEISDRNLLRAQLWDRLKHRGVLESARYAWQYHRFIAAASQAIPELSKENVKAYIEQQPDAAAAFAAISTRFRMLQKQADPPAPGPSLFSQEIGFVVEPMLNLDTLADDKSLHLLERFYHPDTFPTHQEETFWEEQALWNKNEIWSFVQWLAQAKEANKRRQAGGQP